MNRREAVAALMSLPGVARIAADAPAPDEAVIVEVSRDIPPDVAENIRAKISSVWPNRKVLVLCDGIRIRFAKVDA